MEASESIQKRKWVSLYYFSKGTITGSLSIMVVCKRQEFFKRQNKAIVYMEEITSFTEWPTYSRFIYINFPHNYILHSSYSL